MAANSFGLALQKKYQPVQRYATTIAVAFKNYLSYFTISNSPYYMKLLTDVGMAVLGLLIFLALVAIDHQRRKFIQRHSRKDFNN